MFSYDVKNGVGGVDISFIGRLDTLGVSAHESEIMDIVDNSNNVIFDLAELEYCSSAGLRLFLQCQKKMNSRGVLTLINVSDAVYEIFEVTGFNDILHVQ